MKKRWILALLFFPASLSAQSAARVFLDSGFSPPSPLAKALQHFALVKRVPIVVTDKKDEANFVLRISSEHFSNQTGELTLCRWSLFDVTAGTTVASDFWDGSETMCVDHAADAIRIIWRLKGFKADLQAPKPENPGSPPTDTRIADDTRPAAASPPRPTNMTNPMPIYQPKPPYTAEARKAKIEGVVRLACLVRKDGSVGECKVISGLGYGLDESAIRTVEEMWKFEPRKLDGVAVDTRATIEVTWRLGKN